jgi:hypothetical protein
MNVLIGHPPIFLCPKIFFKATPASEKNFLSAVYNERVHMIAYQAGQSIMPLSLSACSAGRGMVGWPHWHVNIWERLVVNWILEKFSSRRIFTTPTVVFQLLGLFFCTLWYLVL